MLPVQGSGIENISNVPGPLSGSPSPMEGLAASQTENEHSLSKLKVISDCTRQPENLDWQSGVRLYFEKNAIQADDLETLGPRDLKNLPLEQIN